MTKNKIAIDPSNFFQFQNFWTRAQDAFTQKKYHHANNFLKQALTHAPEHKEANLLKAKLAVINHQPAQARAIIEALAAKENDPIQSLKFQIQQYQELGMTYNIGVCYQKLFELRPLGKYKTKAIENFIAAAKQKIDAEQYYESAILFRDAFKISKNSEHDIQAGNSLYLAFAQNKEQKHALSAAHIFEKYHDFSRAAEIYQEAFELESSNYKIPFLIGKCYIHKKNLLEATGYFEQTYKLNNSDSKTCYALGYLHRELGDPFKSIIFFNESLKLEKRTNKKENIAQELEKSIDEFLTLPIKDVKQDSQKMQEVVRICEELKLNNLAIQIVEKAISIQGDPKKIIPLKALLQKLQPKFSGTKRSSSEVEEEDEELNVNKSTADEPDYKFHISPALKGIRSLSYENFGEKENMSSTHKTCLDEEETSCIGESS